MDFKLTDIFKQKDKKQENLIFLLALLVIMLIAINYILKDDTNPEENKYADAVLASSSNVTSDLEMRIQNILEKIDKVGKVSVLLTYDDENLEGIIIVAEGAKDANVESNIINAVEAVTGLGKHKIKVYGMEEK